MFKVIFVILLSLSLTNCSFLEEISKVSILRKTKTDLHTIQNLARHGEGVTDAQELFVIGLINTAIRLYDDDLASSAIFVQQGIEKVYSGNWNVEIFTGDPSWGRATHIKNNQWIVLFAYGAYEMDIIIWVAE